MQVFMCQVDFGAMGQSIWDSVKLKLIKIIKIKFGIQEKAEWSEHDL